MKPFRLATLLLVTLQGCSSPEEGQLTQQHRDQIRKEVQIVMDSIAARMLALDADGGLEYYADTPDWVMLRPDGMRWDFQAFRKNWKEFNNSALRRATTILSKDVIVLSRDAVLCAWVGTDETVLKSGETVVITSRAYTLLFRKLGGQWKVVYSHASGLPATQQVAMKQ